MVGFDSDEEAIKFLDYLHELPDDDRKMLLAKRGEGTKVTLTKLGIRAAYLRDV